MIAAHYRPIITICGTTGVGKSKLAVDLALHLQRSGHKLGWKGAKIINADSMQVYKGLDILTNKHPEAERYGIPHLLLGFKDPGEQYVVNEWVQDALKLINEMHENNEVPIIVGGTSYWIQHLIFPNRLVSNEPKLKEHKRHQAWSPELEQSINALPQDLRSLLDDLPSEAPSAKVDPDAAFQLHKLLSLLDPEISQRWHWKDTRKVLRSLEIMVETGKPGSSIIHEQSTRSTAEIEPRFRTLCFWLYADNASLHPRLDARVDTMIKDGLLDEVKILRNLCNANKSVDYTLGIYQSIGYREFCNYLDSPSDAYYKEAVERMKVSTRQYAKRQVSWLRNKLIPAAQVASASTPDIIPFYLLDATALGEEWTKNVEVPALKIQDAFLAQQDLPEAKSLSETATNMLNVKCKDVTQERDEYAISAP
ncbi:hypothetical protein D9619_005654 [Psilocybe cf. subviscida]|uniref:tRNA dimethylallyltransferase n=1 Tax=Psilocybe cf. subviscida TaxID=2480587 RepID=A0A8H5FBE1_9AGAR|nr:hypothetical protein D9619_005654 [Psilocybe cf. subviscida]